MNKKQKSKIKRINKKSIWDLGTKFVIKGGPKRGSIDHDKRLSPQNILATGTDFTRASFEALPN